MKVLTWVVAIIFAFALLLGGIMLVSSGNSEEDAAVTPIKDPWETALKAVENKDIVKFAAALASIDINARDEHGENLLFHTIRSGNKEMTQLLIQKKINLNQENKKGETPLYEAVREKISTCLFSCSRAEQEWCCLSLRILCWDLLRKTVVKKLSLSS